MTQTITLDINSQLLADAPLYSKRMGSDLSRFIEVLPYQVLPNDSKAQTQKTSSSLLTNSALLCSLSVA